MSHASLLVETNGIRLLTDPWYEGTIYNDAGELCPASPRLPDYGSLDAVFISHAHPDHFEMRTLAKILAIRGPDLVVSDPPVSDPAVDDAEIPVVLFATCNAVGVEESLHAAGAPTRASARAPMRREDFMRDSSRKRISERDTVYLYNSPVRPTSHRIRYSVMTRAANTHG